MAEVRVPAYHRHVLITPAPGMVGAWVEDDFHHMGVALYHDDGIITQASAEVIRAPWTTCPGAPAQLVATFTGVRLEAAVARGEKQANCTHLHDMAVLAAAHASDPVATLYEITVTDPLNGVRIAELSRDGAALLRFVERDGVVVEPDAATGKTLFQLGEWIASLTPEMQEAARLLRWAAIVAHGRTVPMERQSDASRMPANCFTFQPGRKEHATRIGAAVDFSTAARQPLQS